ncbi:hypothetical protein JZ751_028278 [Albula glossodonta]|uniref:Uncharacterized protein n=1 Tax=Albula glossodonta TaxID=121402 RepID=A0A8T2N076_9TELE|nr:hypothetical protein JZ751_028278 [Albula glossodonta]
METELHVKLILSLQLLLTAHGDRALTHSTWRQSFQLTSSSYCSSNSHHMETELPALTHSTWRQSFQLTSSSDCSSYSLHMETELPVNLILLLKI